MVNPENLFGASSTRAEASPARAQVVALPNVGDLRSSTVSPVVNPKDSGIAAVAAAAAIGRARAGARAYAREEDGEDMAGLCAYYCDTFDRQRVPPAVKRDINDALAAGMDAAVIRLAMDDAGRAYRPTWTYALAIINRCLADGCYTVAGWAQRKAAHAAKGARRQARQGVNDYTQREYHDEDFSVDAVMEMLHDHDSR